MHGSDNAFGDDVRQHFFFNCYNCYECNGNGTNCGNGLELHHNYGRISDSILNAVPLCRACHNKVKQDTMEQRRYLHKSIKFALSVGYVLQEKDNAFLEAVQKDLLGIVL